LLLLLRWRATRRDAFLCAAALLYGLSFLNHLVMATAAAGFGVFVAMTVWSAPRAARTVWRAALCLVAGLLPYVWLMSQTETAGATGRTVMHFIHGVLYPLQHPRALLRGGAWGVALGLYQFPATAGAGILGLYVLWRRDRAAAAMLALIILGTVAFLFGALDPRAGSTYVWNLHYYLQAYVAFALALAAGFEVVWRRWCGGRRRRQAGVVLASVALPVVLYTAAPAVARRVVPAVPDFRPLPGRDNFRYVLAPWKHDEVGARVYGEEILRALPEGSVLFADYGPWAILRYLQVVEQARPDVEVVRLGVEAAQVPLMLRYGAKPNLFLADTYRYYDLAGIGAHFDIIRAGPIYRLVRKTAWRRGAGAGRG
jgi:hypothetical protein